MSVDERMRDRLARLSMILMAAALFYFIAYGAHQAQRADTAGKKRDQAISALAGTQQGIVTKLTEIFTKTLEAQAAAEAAGKVPQATVEQIVDSLKGYVDAALVQKAVEAATKAVAGPAGATGARGPVGPPGPPGAAASTTTTAAPAGTTTTTRSTSSSSTTTTRPTATTTTRPCTLGLLGACLVR